MRIISGIINLGAILAVIFGWILAISFIAQLQNTPLVIAASLIAVACVWALGDGKRGDLPGEEDDDNTQ
ncbi:hypothetical protein NYE48_28000 [Paenibacillus sp. FSL M7-1455]|uniref:hypothetical protein n=1 Tax=Paenibacillus sp. FSL M7-1455 TaxID=2975316 RepID=UPI0030F5B4D6